MPVCQGEVLRRVQNAARLPGVDQIVLPGERERKMALARVKEGTVPLERNMLGHPSPSPNRPGPSPNPSPSPSPSPNHNPKGDRPSRECIVPSERRPPLLS